MYYRHYIEILDIKISIYNLYLLFITNGSDNFAITVIQMNDILNFTTSIVTTRRACRRGSRVAEDSLRSLSLWSYTDCRRLLKCT